jgi:hypothetical protein
VNGHFNSIDVFDPIPSGIDNAGHIVGLFDPSGLTLTVPEPGMLLQLGLGLLGLGWACRFAAAPLRAMPSRLRVTPSRLISRRYTSLASAPILPCGTSRLPAAAKMLGYCADARVASAPRSHNALYKTRPSCTTSAIPHLRPVVQQTATVGDRSPIAQSENCSTIARYLTQFSDLLAHE